MERGTQRVLAMLIFKSEDTDRRPSRLTFFLLLPDADRSISLEFDINMIAGIEMVVFANLFYSRRFQGQRFAEM